MREFVGFPSGPLAATPLPNLFFSQALPAIDDLVELKLALHFFWRLHCKKSHPRYLTRRELEGDTLLRRSLQAYGEPTKALGEALERLVGDRLVLCLKTEIGGRPEEVYLLNDARGREAVERLRQGTLDLGGPTTVLGPTPDTRRERPCIFDLYEQNIGLLTPLLLDELVEAQQLYPPEWVEEAFRQAVQYNRRNWRYVKRILERWAVEGKR